MFLLSLQKENRAKIWFTLFPKKDRFVGYALSVFYVIIVFVSKELVFLSLRSNTYDAQQGIKQRFPSYMPFITPLQ
ncbi:hypothetical protein CAPN004_05980 [Capnocytophaga cynodegmi]|uniref:hypothetical protein n=1 Tax=Capnocytophaga cynodegmi TaxID=28189 RepID=UPI001ACB2AC3|nr:hypothetical protein [Capnocytophaga cynodegmi]GIM51568.1 hypothetical protein CAPN004_05980 [Capnocytophaga cynodegmi]